MHSKILILRFPIAEVQKPLVCHLTKKFDLVFTILNATILPRKEGIMVLELTGPRKNFKEGVQYLKDNNVNVQKASQEIKRNNKICTHCGSCTAVCPTGALYIERPEMRVRFDEKKCSICELCIPACPPRAMEVRQQANDIFFE